MKKVMKKSAIRQRKAEVLLLLISLVVLSVTYVGLLASSYSAYLDGQDEHTLTCEGHSSLPSVTSSFGDTSSDDTELSGTSDGDSGAVSDGSELSNTDTEAATSPGEEYASVTYVTYERTVSGHAILLGDADMLSIYSYDQTDATVCATSGVSAANVLASSFIASEVSTKERTVEQILNLGDYDTCYLFLGVHETEWYYEDSFIEYYETLIMEIQELAPDMVIYIHAIPTVSELAEAGVSTGATDEHIAELNVKLKALAKEYGDVVYVEL